MGMPPEVSHLHLTRLRSQMCTQCSNLIYHKFSHGALSICSVGQKINVMLELRISKVACIYFSVQPMELTSVQGPYMPMLYLFFQVRRVSG